MNHPATGNCWCGKVCYLTEHGFLCAEHEPKDEPVIEMYEYVCTCKDVSISFDDDEDKIHEIRCPLCGQLMEEA